MTPNLQSRCYEQIFECKNIQNGDPGNDPNLPATRGMGDIAGFQRRLFPHSSSQPVLEIPPSFHFQNQTFQFRALPFGLSTAT